MSIKTLNGSVSSFITISNFNIDNSTIHMLPFAVKSDKLYIYLIDHIFKNLILDKMMWKNPRNKPATRFGEADHPGPRDRFELPDWMEELRFDCQDEVTSEVLDDFSVTPYDYENGLISSDLIRHIEDQIEERAEPLYERALEEHQEQFEEDGFFEEQLMEDCRNEVTSSVLANFGVSNIDFINGNTDLIFEIEDKIEEVALCIFNKKLEEKERLDWFLDSYLASRTLFLAERAKKRILFRKLTVVTGYNDVGSPLNSLPESINSFILKFIS